MKELYEFLNSQDGGTLFWCGIFIIVLLSEIFDGVAKITKAFRKEKEKIKE